MPVAAVITGDIVNSMLLAPKLEKKMITQLGVLLKGHKFEFYRGDSFQVYVKNPYEALELLFRLRAQARCYSLDHDVRGSIGIGKINMPLRDLRTATGEAFVLSGRAFDKLSGDQRMQIQCANKQANAALRVIAYYGDFIFKRLTSKQAEVVLELLKQNTQIKAAKKLRKSQATISKHLQAAAWSEIQKLIAEYKHVITQFKIV
ncbi:MAG TPA: hypothetical protein VFV68_07530 [Agriterribacter sp.]|nr:hypothetical protein [Agriterribacter sp.]